MRGTSMCFNITRSSSFYCLHRRMASLEVKRDPRLGPILYAYAHPLRLITQLPLERACKPYRVAFLLLHLRESARSREASLPDEDWCALLRAQSGRGPYLAALSEFLGPRGQDEGWLDAHGRFYIGMRIEAGAETAAQQIEVEISPTATT